MGSVVTYSLSDARELRELRRRAREASALPDLHPWGWSVDLVDPDAVLDALGGFDRDGAWRWSTAHHRGPEGTASFLWAIPASASRVDPRGWPAHDGSTPPPNPSGALDDPMDAILGERSEWTLLCASLLQRELAELGGTGGYCRWGKHDLLALDPWTTLTPSQRAQNHLHMREGSYWMEEIPTDLRPRVEADTQRVGARFHTLRREYHLPVYLHEDVYAEEGFRVVPGRRLIGRVPYKRPAWAGDLHHPDL